MLQVITHNGRPVSEGGKRIGYRASDPDMGTVTIPIGDGATVDGLIAMKRAALNGTLHQVQAPVSVKSRPKPIDYFMLSRRRWDCYCPKCNCFIDNELGQLRDTTAGMQTVLECPNCRTLLR